MIGVFDEGIASTGDGVFCHKGLSNRKFFYIDEESSLGAANALEAKGSRTVLMRVLVAAMIHVLAVGGHRRGRRIGSG